MAYKFRGVPMTFETKEQALAFLRGSPGYMRRQQTYLRRYWPGLYLEAGAKVPGQEKLILRARSNRLRGKRNENLFTLIERGAKAAGTEFAEAALGGNKPQRGPLKMPPAAAGALAGAGGAAKTAIDVAVGPETRKLIGGAHASPLGLGIEAAGVLPFGKPLRAARAARAASEAAKVGEVAVKSADELDAIQKARQGLKGAAAVRGRQEAGYSAERAARAGAAEKAMQVGGVEGYRASLRELKGELPKLNFAGFSHLDDDAVDHLLTHIQQHQHLRPYQKVTAMGAVVKATEGKVPTRGELNLLENVFGKEVARNLGNSENLSVFAKAWRPVLEAWNVPRSLMASFDLSAPFRQGLVAGARHPMIFARNFKPMVKAFGSEKVHQAVMDDIVTRPTFPMMRKAGLALTDLGALETREEQFFSNVADKLPGVRNSSRAYSGFLNKMRADVFDHLIGVAQKDGLNVQDPQFLKSLATYINSSTGRGDLGALQPAAVVLNSFFFSPRLMMSRFNFLNPAYYARLDPFARKQALRAALQTAGTVTSLLGLAYMAGARVNTDPRNADFAKVRIGDSRFDIAGGFQQPIRLISQLASGKVISSTTGKELALGPQGPGKLSRRDITQRFFESKLAPSPSLINDWLKGTNFLGEEFSWSKGAYSRMLPLLAQDAYELYQHEEGGVNGIAAAFGAYGVGAFGVGFQTYADGEKKSAAPARYGKPRSSARRRRVSNKPSRRRDNKPG